MIPAMVLAFACVASDPVDMIERRECDLIELNFFYEDRPGMFACECDSVPVFVQVIAWRWNPEPMVDSRGRWVGTVDRLRSHGFMLLQDRTQEYQGDRPTRAPGGMWVVNRGRFVVTAPAYRETHTNIDPEREDRRRSPWMTHEKLFDVDFIPISQGVSDGEN